MYECVAFFESCTPNDLINDDTPVFTKPPRKHTAKSICELKEDIVAYRSSSCVDLSCPNVALIVGVEICSSITGSMIDQVIYHCAQITSVSDLIVWHTCLSCRLYFVLSLPHTPNKTIEIDYLILYNVKLIL